MPISKMEDGSVVGSFTFICLHEHCVAKVSVETRLSGDEGDIRTVVTTAKRVCEALGWDALNHRCPTHRVN